MDQKIIHQRIDKLLKLQEDIRLTYLKFIRAITTIATGLLALLIALKPDEISNKTAKYLFVSGLLLIAIGIFSSIIAQFYDVKYQKHKFEGEKEMLREYKQKGNPEQVWEIPKKEFIFRICEYIMFISLGLSLFVLVAYAYFAIL